MKRGFVLLLFIILSIISSCDLLLPPGVYEKINNIVQESTKQKLFISITSGGDYSLALKEDGSLWATGGNTSGQLGMGDIYDRKTWTKVSP